MTTSVDELYTAVIRKSKEDYNMLIKEMDNEIISEYNL